MASFVGGCVDFVVCLVEWFGFVWYIAFIALVVVIWILFAVLGWLRRLWFGVCVLVGYCGWFSGFVPCAAG